MLLSPDPPDPPTRLKIQAVKKDTITLTWKAPKNDGGSPVTHYNMDLLCWDASGTQKESWRRYSTIITNFSLLKPHHLLLLRYH